MVPAHLTIKTVAQILLKREGEAGVTPLFSQKQASISDSTVEQIYEEFMDSA